METAEIVKIAVERHRVLIVKPVHRGGHIIVVRGIHIVELGVEYINRMQHTAGHGILPQFAQRKNALVLGERRALAQLGGGGDIEHLDAEGVDDGLHGVGYRAGLRGKFFVHAQHRLHGDAFKHLEHRAEQQREHQKGGGERDQSGKQFGRKRRNALLLLNLEHGLSTFLCEKTLYGQYITKAHKREEKFKITHLFLFKPF